MGPMIFICKESVCLIFLVFLELSKFLSEQAMWAPTSVLGYNSYNAWQTISLSLSMVSVPAPELVVDSFPLKSHKKVDPADGGNDASLNSNYLE